jgi:hypothetical protein
MLGRWVGENVIILFLTQLSVINPQANVTYFCHVTYPYQQLSCELCEVFQIRPEGEKVGGRVATDTTFNGVLKVPRQFPFVLLVELRLREGKASTHSSTLTELKPS